MVVIFISSNSIRPERFDLHPRRLVLKILALVANPFVGFCQRHGGAFPSLAAALLAVLGLVEQLGDASVLCERGEDAQSSRKSESVAKWSRPKSMPTASTLGGKGSSSTTQAKVTYQ